MKITKYNTRDASNIPKKCSLKDPYTGETLIDDDGRTVDIYVYGAQSDRARNALKARDRKYGKQAKLTDEQAEQSGAEFLAALTQGWSDNLEDDNGSIAYTGPESAAKLYIEQDWIARQVNLFAMDIRNYDPLRSSGSGSTSDNSHGSTPSLKDKSEAGESK